MKRVLSIILLLLACWFGFTLLYSLGTFIWAIVTFIPWIGKEVHVGNEALGSSDPMDYFKTMLLIIAVKAALCFVFFWAARKLIAKKTPQTG
jgi:biotin transporter BioY